MSDHTEQDTNSKISKAPRIGLFFTFVGIIILASLLTYGYFKAMHNKVLLSHLASNTEQQLANLENRLNQFKTEQAHLQQSFDSVRETTSNQAQLSGEHESSLAMLHVREAYFLVNLANDYLQLLHDQTTAKTLLLAAANKIQNMPETSVNGLREAITRDLTALNNSSSNEISTLYLSLSALHDKLDALPLLKMPLQPTATTEVETYPASLSWWQRASHYLIEGLQKIVIVRRDDVALPLIVPQEKMFLYQNLHAQLEGVMWATLHHQNKIYQTNLMMMMSWIKRYFDTNASLTQDMLGQLALLQKENIEPSLLNLSPTLTMFDQYFAEKH